MRFLIVSRVRKGDRELSDWRLLFHSWVLDLLQYELRATFLCREREREMETSPNRRPSTGNTFVEVD